MDAPEVDGLVFVEVPKGIILRPGESILAKIRSAQEYDLIGTYLHSERP